VIGTGIGAAIRGGPATVKAFRDSRIAKADRANEAADRETQRAHEAQQAAAQRDSDRRAIERAERVQKVREWREGLAASHSEFVSWENRFKAYGPGRPMPSQYALRPNIAGAVWFQSLRPHLPESGFASSSDPAFYSMGEDIQCDNDAADVLSKEITRIEREWLADTYPGSRHSNLLRRCTRPTGFVPVKGVGRVGSAVRR
jgi:hypothetical protein